MEMVNKNIWSRVVLDHFVFYKRNCFYAQVNSSMLLLCALFFFPIELFSQTYSLPYQQNFDTVSPPSLPSNWTTTTNRRASGDFKTIASAPHSSPNAVIDSNSVIAQTLFSPMFDFTGKIGDSLTFYERRNSTHRSGIILDAVVNNDTTSPIAISDTLRFVVANSYVRRGYALPTSLNNQLQVQFRWRVLGDSGTSAGFVRFDDIIITSKTQYDAAVSSLSFLPSFPTVGDSIRIIASLKNIGLVSFQNDTMKFYYDVNNDSSAQQNELFSTKIISSTIVPNDSILVEAIFPNAVLGNARFMVQSNLTNDENNSNDEFIASTEVGVKKIFCCCE